MIYAEEEQRPPRSHPSRQSAGLQFPYSGIPASPSSGPVSYPASASSRFGVGADQGLGHFAGSNVHSNTNTSQGFSEHISPGNFSPFITGPGSGSNRPGQEYPHPYTAILHEPRPTHPQTTVPMQLEYILNRSGRRSSAASSPLSRLPSGQDYSPSTVPNVLSSSSGQEPTVSISDTLPHPPAVSTYETENRNDNNSRTPPQAATTTATTPIRMDFEPVTAHTAKCDLCNSRNDSGMSRCTSCGWQSCHACTIANGCTRTHNAGSRVHTGPIEKSKLLSMAASSSSRGRVGKRVRAQPRRKREGDEGEGEDGRVQVGPTRWSKRQQRARNNPRSRRSGSKEDHGVDADAASCSPPRSSPPGIGGSSSSSTDDLSEREKMLQGARNLYAFSIEAWGIWAREQRTEDQNRRGGRLGIENLHSYAQNEATRALEEYKREAGRVNRVW